MTSKKLAFILALYSLLASVVLGGVLVFFCFCQDEMPITQAVAKAGIVMLLISTTMILPIILIVRDFRKHFERGKRKE